MTNRGKIFILHVTKEFSKLVRKKIQEPSREMDKADFQFGIIFVSCARNPATGA